MMTRGNMKRISMEQRESMLQFMVENPDLAKNKLSGPLGRITKSMKWKELAGILNSCPAGVYKTPDKWSRSWQDWKADVKQKTSRLRRLAAGNRGGHSRGTELTAIEERLLRFMGGTEVNGVTGVVDPIELNPMSPDKASGSAVMKVEGAHMIETPAAERDEDEILAMIVQANERIVNIMEGMVNVLKEIVSAHERNTGTMKVILETLAAHFCTTKDMENSVVSP